LGDDFAAQIAGIGAEINHPIGGLNDVEVVFDDEDGVAGIDEALKDLEQDAHVIEVQAVVGSSNRKRVGLVSPALARVKSRGGGRA